MLRAPSLTTSKATFWIRQIAGNLLALGNVWKALGFLYPDLTLSSQMHHLAMRETEAGIEHIYRNVSIFHALKRVGACPSIRQGYLQWRNVDPGAQVANARAAATARTEAKLEMLASPYALQAASSEAGRKGQLPSICNVKQGKAVNGPAKS